jgi:carbon monoxide dehydrogenase subunit G
MRLGDKTEGHANRTVARAVSVRHARALEAKMPPGSQIDRDARDAFENVFDIPLSPAEAWPVLSDIRRMATCMPGVELTGMVDDTTYEGRFTVQLGPAPLTYAGTLRVRALDGAHRRARIEAQGTGNDGRAYGAATFHIEATDGGSKVLVHTDINLSGAPGRLGHGAGAIQAAAARAVRQFAANLQAQLAAAQRS